MTTRVTTKTVSTTVKQGGSVAVDVLSGLSGLPKMRVKDAMVKGAVWLRQSGRKRRKRLRRAKTVLGRGDTIELYYDAVLLALVPPEAECIHDAVHYSVWVKPAGLMAQGTMYGDHCSLLRQAELFFGNARPVFPVHRLDREASGIMLVAHSREAASKLSGLFQERSVRKEYHAEVAGNLGPAGREERIELPLDGRDARTGYRVTAYDSIRDISTVSVTIDTGRLHQIRRHFAMIGHPVTGDPRYGSGSRDREGMRLNAVALAFHCPFSNRDVEYRLPS